MVISSGGLVSDDEGGRQSVGNVLFLDLGQVHYLLSENSSRCKIMICAHFYTYFNS